MALQLRPQPLSAVGYHLPSASAVTIGVTNIFKGVELHVQLCQKMLLDAGIQIFHGRARSLQHLQAGKLGLSPTHEFAALKNPSTKQLWQTLTCCSILLLMVGTSSSSTLSTTATSSCFALPPPPLPLLPLPNFGGLAGGASPGGTPALAPLPALWSPAAMDI